MVDLNNPNFKPHIYEGFKVESLENTFWLSLQKWVENTNAIGLISKAGRYGGGTYAHKDIAFKKRQRYVNIRRPPYLEIMIN